MQNCKWEIINYRENDCDCDYCIDIIEQECDNETRFLEEGDI